MPRPPREIVLDERRRTSLARVGRKQDTRYLVQEYEDGTLVLTPAVTISEKELAVLRDPDLRRKLEEGLDAEPRPARPRRRPEGQSPAT